MANSFFTFTPFDFNEVQGSYSPIEDFEMEEALFKQRQDQYLFGIELGEANPIISNEYGFQQEQTAKKGIQLLKEHLQHQQPTSNDLIMDEFEFSTISISPPTQHQQPKSNDLTLDEFHFNTFFPPTQSIHESTGLTHIPTKDSEIPKHIKQIPRPYSLASLELLRNYRRGFKKLKGEKLNETSTETKVGSYKLSTEEIMWVAGERYVRFSTQNQIYDDYCMPMHPFGSALLSFSEEETRDVELVHLLLAAAEKVGYQQYERASKLLLRCERISLARANPAQRVVFHFAEALQERIDKELGRAPMKEFKPYEEIFLGMCTNPSLVRAYEKLPFSQIAVFTGIEAILENVTLESKVHLLDIGIRCGAHWTVLMKALVERKDFPIELLTITAVEFTGKKYGDIDETRKRLVSVAESLNLPFPFKSVLLSDMKDIQELFEIEDYKAVIVYAPYILCVSDHGGSTSEKLKQIANG